MSPPDPGEPGYVCEGVAAVISPGGLAPAGQLVVDTAVALRCPVCRVWSARWWLGEGRLVHVPPAGDPIG